MREVVVAIGVRRAGAVVTGLGRRVTGPGRGGILRREGHERSAEQAGYEGRQRAKDRERDPQQAEGHHDAVDAGLRRGDQERDRRAPAGALAAQRRTHGNDPATAKRQGHAEQGRLEHRPETRPAEMPLDRPSRDKHRQRPGHGEAEQQVRGHIPQHLPEVIESFKQVRESLLCLPPGVIHGYKGCFHCAITGKSVLLERPAVGLARRGHAGDPA